ncbi:MAG: methyltransferase [Pseudomonadota bacterium]|nr:methyltransferase [Pseudomonadota bacterium]
MSDDAATRPFDGATAKHIARAFLPAFPLGNRYDYYYTLAKLRSDPLYPGVLAALRGSRAPLLDLGCGLGLLAHALRLDGQAMAYRGVDIDARKIARAGRIAAKTGLCDTGFEIVDLAHRLPSHNGSVTLLDVLQYLSADAQRGLLEGVVSMLTPGARLVIRTSLADGSGRGRTTRISDRLAHVLGWMQAVPKHYPTRESLCAQLSAAGLTTTFEPLYAATPFNNWLVVATKA